MDASDRITLPKPKRLREPGAERKQWSERIRRAVEMYGTLRRKTATNKGDMFVFGHLRRAQVHLRPQHKDFKLFKSIIQTLEQLRGNEFNNHWEYMLEDYFECLTQYWKRRNHAPFLGQLAPTDFNLHLFGEWIRRFEETYDEPYFRTNCSSPEEARARAVASLKACAKAHVESLQNIAADIHLPDPLEFSLKHGITEPED